MLAAVVVRLSSLYRVAAVVASLGRAAGHRRFSSSPWQPPRWRSTPPLKPLVLAAVAEKVHDITCAGSMVVLTIH